MGWWHSFSYLFITPQSSRLSATTSSPTCSPASLPWISSQLPWAIGLKWQRDSSSVDSGPHSSNYHPPCPCPARADENNQTCQKEPKPYVNSILINPFACSAKLAEFSSARLALRPMTLILLHGLLIYQPLHREIATHHSPKTLIQI